MFIIFDTETTGLPKDWKAPITDTDNWPRCIQIAWQLHDEMGELIESKDYLVKPVGFSIPYQAEKIHGISTDLALEQGVELEFVLEEFNTALAKAKFVVGQNVGFDVNVMGCEFHRMGVDTNMVEMPVLDTCTEITASMCQIPGGRGGKFKLPTLTELHEFLFGEPFAEAHNATADVEATTRCFLELIRLRKFTAEQMEMESSYFNAYAEANPSRIQTVGLSHQNLKEESARIKERKAQEAGDGDAVDTAANLEALKDVRFSHLHNHTMFSILQSTSEVKSLVQAAIDDGHRAVALTDTANMMAAFHFVRAALNHNGGIKGKIAALEEEWKEAASDEEKADLKAQIEEQEQKKIIPILGCDFNVCRDHTNKTVKDPGSTVPMLAKNRNGYHNLAKMASAAFIDGFYYVPRIDKDLVVAHKEDVIVLTGGLTAEIPNLILNEGEEKAEESFKWWHEQFGEDFYVELNRHGLEEEDLVNETLLRFAEKYGVKCIAANNTFYLEQKDAEAHDILLCVKAGEKKSTPIGRGRGFRFGFPNDEFYFKSQDQMKRLFQDLPDAIANTNEIVDKIEIYDLARDVLLPAFDIPEEFQDERDLEDPSLKIGENNFLRHLTYEGAKKRYPEITDEIRERLDFELSVIQNTGYPGYFLIVQDFCNEARRIGVSVGPGRGSAAGSAVAYCNGITNVDPIHYDLLFERFLNPDRVSLPDIDIDFDDEGRGRVIDYVINKYGSSQVAQIITYGTMAAKSSIRDCGRVLELPLPDTDRVAKLVPDIKLKKMFAMDDVQLSAKLNPDQIGLARQLKGIYEMDTQEGEVLRQAHKLEGSVRNTGIHACGVIITPSDIREIAPMAVAKDSDMWCTQFDNSVVEDAGLLKMDFLGLKTLTLIKDALKIVKARHGVDIDIEEIPIDDTATYELFQRGETVGIFQYESAGMQKHMKSLKPTVFADLIAMNALYRPGPLEYIPSFIRRKHGEEEIVYDLDACQEYLEETYGITVYQEQVMLLSQSLAGFTKGEADTLRKAMGKKKLDLLAKLKPKFLDQGEEKGHNRDKLEKIWKDWEAFASYAFNKSHSTCYAWIAYQTAYLKAHYPAEYMASVLSNNMNDIKSVTFFMEECRRMGLEVLGPDINESYYKFAVNNEGAVRFGLGAVRGIGEGAVRALVEERKENGPYKSIFDFSCRVSLKDCNKRVFESMALSGAFDRYEEIHRAQYFFKEHEKASSLLEKAIKYGQAYQNGQESNQVSMFGGEGEVDMPEPVPPRCEEWGNLEKLNKEKEMIGIFISGHPLDDYKLEINNFCNARVNYLDDLPKYANKDLSIGGIITNAQERMTKRGQPFGIFEIEDYSGSKEIFMFSEDYLKFKHMLAIGAFIWLKGKVQNRKWGAGDLEFKVTQMDLLDKARNKASALNIEMDLDDLNDALIMQLYRLAESNEGNCRLRFTVVDRLEKIKVNMPSKSLKVQLTNQLIDGLEELDGVEYTVS